LALASRALIHSRDGETLSFLYSFMYHFFWRRCCWDLFVE